MRIFGGERSTASARGRKKGPKNIGGVDLILI
jgi:hypothetical protein